MSEVCGDCKYYLPQDGDNGVCRRYPPQMMVAERVMAETLVTGPAQKPQTVIRTTQASSVFPIISAIGYCGEFTLPARDAKDVN